MQKLARDRNLATFRDLFCEMPEDIHLVPLIFYKI